MGRPAPRRRRRAPHRSTFRCALHRGGATVRSEIALSGRRSTLRCRPQRGPETRRAKTCPFGAVRGTFRCRPFIEVIWSGWDRKAWNSLRYLPCRPFIEGPTRRCRSAQPSRFRGIFPLAALHRGDEYGVDKFWDIPSRHLPMPPFIEAPGRPGPTRPNSGRGTFQSCPSARIADPISWASGRGTFQRGSVRLTALAHFRWQVSVADGTMRRCAR